MIKIELIAPARLAVQYEALLNQQCWCWGCDARQPENLLCRYGFMRQPAPDPTQTHSLYRWNAPDAAVMVWGFGVQYAESDKGGVFLRRYDTRPRWIAPDALTWTAGRANQIVTTLPPDPCLFQALTARACRWIAGYERWIAAHTDADYRHTTVEACPKTRLRTLPASAMAAAWDSLGETWE